MIQLAKRVIRQTVNDKRSVMLILVAPLLILTLVYLLLGDSDYVATVGIEREAVPAPVITALEQQELTLVDLTASQAEQADDYLQQHQDVDAVLRFPENAGMAITLYEPSKKGATAMAEIQDAMADVNPSADTEVSYVYGTPDQSTFDSLGSERYLLTEDNRALRDVAACVPYDALYIDPETHTAAKCNFCAHRLDGGFEPAAVVLAGLDAPRRGRGRRRAGRGRHPAHGSRSDGPRYARAAGPG